MKYFILILFILSDIVFTFGTYLRRTGISLTTKQLKKISGE